LRILCEAFQIDGDSDRCESRLIEEAIAQPGILTKLSLSVNDDVKSRVTYSALMPKLAPNTTTTFILSELDRVALAHSTLTDEALKLIIRSGEGVLRATGNLCVACLLETVRDRTRVVDLKQVN
jgi:hypothetical protein